MGVDYIAHYGIGVEVNLSSLEYDEEEYDEEAEYVDEILQETDYTYFKTGCELSGEIDGLYICIPETLNIGFEALTEKINEFKKFLNEKNIPFKDDVDIVGGLLIW